MKIPIPFIVNGKLFTDLSVKPPRTDVISETKEKGQSNLYEGMLVFAVGSVSEILDEDGNATNDKAGLKVIIQGMPYRNIEWVMIQAIIASGINDVIEGIYPCPKCKTEFTPPDPDPLFDETDPEHNSDDADRIRKLKIVYLDKPRELTISLSSPVQKIDADTDEVLEECNSVKLRDPTLDDMIRACRKVGMSNSDRLNSAVYAEATLEANGVKVDRKWKNEWGTWLYDRLLFKDTKIIREEFLRYGVKQSVERRCGHCRKEWEAEVDTGSFFASGLAG